MDLRGQDNNNRPDLLKVRRKVLDSYPINSIARKHLIQEEKVRDLQDFAIQTTPHNIINIAIALGRHSCMGFLKKVGLGTLGLCAILGLCFFSTTMIEVILLSSIGLFLLHWTAKFIHLFIAQVLSIKILKERAKHEQEILLKLKKDLFE